MNYENNLLSGTRFYAKIILTKDKSRKVYRDRDYFYTVEILIYTARITLSLMQAV